MKQINIFTILTIISILCSCSNNNTEDNTSEKKNLFTTGTGKILYKCEAPFQDKEIDIYYHIPDGKIEDMPVQIVMHGVGRNAVGYRDNWIAYAEKYKFIVLVPHFTKEMFPEIEYQQGAILDADGNINSKEKVTYNLISEVFNYFLDKSASKAKSCNIYGHSAGAQFVHRFMLYSDTPYINKAVSANAGWYTFPSDTIGFPYGIGETMSKMGLDKANYYKKNMIVLLGDADTLRTSNLRQTPEADAQGLNRFERGNKFYNYCKDDARKANYEFNWKLQYVENAKHSDKQMAPIAADILYGNK